MVVRQGLVAHARRKWRDSLALAGFKKRSGDIYTRTSSSDVLGWIGLNLAVNRADGILEVNPVVGVRHQPIERIVAELNGSSFHAYIPPTTSVHIGYIMPEGRYHPCLFGDEAEVEEATADMVDTIVEYGLSLMIETSQTQALLRALCNGAAATQEHVAYRLPVTYVLMGERDHARAVLGESVERLGDRGDPAAQRLRDYAIAFAKWVEQTENSDRG